MSSLMKWMALSLSLLTLMLAGCGESGTFSGGGTASTTDGTAITYSLDNAYTLKSDLVVDATTTIYAIVKDSTGALASGQSVTFSIDNGFFDGSDEVTDTTDSSGVAEATLTAPALVGSGTVRVEIAGDSPQTISVTYKAGDIYYINLKASPTSVGASGGSTLTSEVWDSHRNVITNGYLVFQFADPADNVSGASLNGFPSGVEALAHISNGTASITYAAGDIEGTDTVSVVPDGETTPTASVDIVVSSAASNVGSITLSPVKNSITADGVSATTIEVTVLDRDGQPMELQAVVIKTTAGDFNTTASDIVTDDITTDIDGIASILLYSSTSLEKAYVTASIGGFSETATVDFVAGPPVAIKSTISVSPSTLPADGSSTAIVTVTLADANSHPVADGTVLTLMGVGTSAGSTAAITTANPATTVGGRVTFTVQAPTADEPDATLYLAELSGLSGTLQYGAVATGVPANIQVEAAASQIYVAGVGKQENTTITVTVYDGAGALIGDPLDGSSVPYNNLRVALLTRPHGGESVTGADKDGVAQTDSSTIDVITTDGSATLSLQSGSLPGVLEIRIDVIDDTGALLSPEVSAIVPQIAIASGPAYSIVLTSPNLNAIEDLTGGVYKRVGTAIVTDRFGNAVPDGTAVNYGLIDTVIAADDDAATTATATTLTDADTTLGDSTNLDAAYVVRNGYSHAIAANDRVLILNAAAEDKSRFVSSTATTNTVVTVQNAYNNAATDLSYIIGNSFLGGQIIGVDEAGSAAESVGYGTTKDGQSTFYVKYPANANTIRVGCGIWGYACSDPSYQTDDAGVGCSDNAGTWGLYRDQRYNPNSSAEVYAVASTSESATASAVTVDQGQFCFASIAGWQMSAIPASLTGDGTVTLMLKDGGDDISLPFVHLTPFVTIDTLKGLCSDPAQTSESACIGAAGTWTLDDFNIDTTNLGCITDNPGQFAPGDSVTGSCSASVVVTGLQVQSGDKATITWYAGDATASVTVEIP